MRNFSNQSTEQSLMDDSTHNDAPVFNNGSLNPYDKLGESSSMVNNLIQRDPFDEWESESFLGPEQREHKEDTSKSRFFIPSEAGSPNNANDQEPRHDPFDDLTSGLDSPLALPPREEYDRDVEQIVGKDTSNKDQTGTGVSETAPLVPLSPQLPQQVFQTTASTPQISDTSYPSFDMCTLKSETSKLKHGFNLIFGKDNIQVAKYLIDEVPFKEKMINRNEIFQFTQEFKNEPELEEAGTTTNNQTTPPRLCIKLTGLEDKNEIKNKLQKKLREHFTNKGYIVFESLKDMLKAISDKNSKKNKTRKKQTKQSRSTEMHLSSQSQQVFHATALSSQTDNVTALVTEKPKNDGFIAKNSKEITKNKDNSSLPPTVIDHSFSASRRISHNSEAISSASTSVNKKLEKTLSEFRIYGARFHDFNIINNLSFYTCVRQEFFKIYVFSGLNKVTNLKVIGFARYSIDDANEDHSQKRFIDNPLSCNKFKKQLDRNNVWKKCLREVLIEDGKFCVGFDPKTFEETMINEVVNKYKKYCGGCIFTTLEEMIEYKKKICYSPAFFMLHK